MEKLILKMRIIYILSIVTLLISCSSKNNSSNNSEVQGTMYEEVTPGFQSIIDSANVTGSILVHDLQSGIFYSNNFDWARKGKLPASTFKIVNSIIALETQVVYNDSTIFKWDGKRRGLRSWEQDLSLKEAFHFSCVPCYQEVARDIGAIRMNKYMGRLGYGDMIVDSTNIDMFWLEGESQISQFQQIDFLKNLYLSELAISKRTDRIMKRMMVIEENTEYKLSGKTGWSISNENNNGWFVGYIESGNKTYLFATNVEPKQDFDMNQFPMIRKEVTIKSLKEMKIIH